MANLIQIKRSLNTATPGSLANGELAYTANGDVLYIGSNGSIEAIGGKRVPGTLTANQALIANSTSGIDKIIVANAVVTAITANGSLGTAGYYLTSNGTASYWSQPMASVAGSDTQVQFNDGGNLAGDSGLTYNKTTDTLTATNFSGNGALVTSVNAATVGGNTASDLRSYSDTTAATAYSNATSYADTKAGNAYTNATSYAATIAGTAYSNATSYADTASGTAYSNAMSDTLSRNGTYTGNNIFSADVTINGNTTIGSNTSDSITVTAQFTSNVMPSANLTYHIGNNTLRWAQVHGGNGHFVTGTFDSHVQIAGDLTVSGNVTTTNVSDLIVSDPLIHLAANNETSDIVDIGFVGHYSDDGGSTKKHVGFFRDASDGGVFKLFTNSQDANLDAANSITINTTATGYATAILETYLRSSGLVSNSSVTNITANSTVSVTITANTLALSTALAGTSGGTGLASYTAEDILVANSSNGFRKLGLGTSGYVLQSNGTALVYDALDGGSF